MPAPTVHLALLGWIPLTILLFAVLPPRRAVLVAVFGGVMFLPIYGYDVRGLPAYTKSTAISLGALLGVFLVDPVRIFSFRPSWLDIPIVVWCLCPIASSLTNGLGLYDGLSTALTHILTWGVPYALGRMYFGDPGGARALAIGAVVAGLVYIPFCLYEVRMSPQLHRQVYGFFQHGFAQTIRFGGFRPMVFMQHGLAVSMFMAAACLCAIWLWFAGGVKRLGSVPMWVVVGALLVTMILCRSLGAIVLLFAGVGCLLALRVPGTRLALLAVFIAPILYMTARTGSWSGEDLAKAAEIISVDRADSLRVRLHSEDLLTDKALQRPLFGWGGWNRARVFDDYGNDQTITDGLWVIALGNTGILGLAAVTAAIALPPLRLVVRHSPRVLASGPAAPAAALCTVLAMHAADNIFNAMTSPIFMMMAGGAAGLASMPRRAPARTPARRRAPAPAAPTQPSTPRPTATLQTAEEPSWT